MYMKGFFDLEENCKEKIISEDYWDFIIPLYRDEELKEVNPENACIQEMDFGYKSVSVDRRILLPLSFREYWYSTIPKCYTLLDMQPLDAAGIITLQNYPTLQLMGHRAKFIELPSSEIISKTEKAVFSELINQSTGMEKDELVVYYRLAILVESILIQYRK